MVEKTEYYPEIKHYVLSKIKNPEDSEDLTQQVFLEYYKAKDRGDNFQNSRAYLFGTARKKVSDYFRQKKILPLKVQIKINLDENISDQKHINTSDSKEITEELETIISKLPPKAREAIKLRLIENLSYEEAAKRANCSIQNFYERFYKGIKIIRNIMNS